MTSILSKTVSHSLKLLAVVMLSLSLAGCGVNNIPTKEQQAKADWSKVLNEYKRRSDVIPNLVETVKGFAQQEEDVLTKVIEARNKATSIKITPEMINDPAAMKKFQDAQKTLGGALRQLMVVVERYPDIKSGQNFLALQSQIEGTENRIAISRRDYIESVRAYNTELITIPGRWWRAFLYPGYKEMASFTIDEAETTTPKVDFNTSN
ncbi:MAG: LemA family protein [Hyphomicrobiaceae bacterium]